MLPHPTTTPAALPHHPQKYSVAAAITFQSLLGLLLITPWSSLEEEDQGVMSVYKYCVEMASLDMEMMNHVWEERGGEN